ncbi:MAG: asparagine synthase (glutamine-hydrolyzing) [Deltaproteobacteria bacterium]|nr:asparagine synthase (glutamine-hydrolyzing) [Deltaproteobacteria bacterium]
MCGIAGATRNMLGDFPEKSLERMNAVMTHRGPDMGDIFLDASMGLCHRRLSIIDLSGDGRQPMTSADGRFTIVFNGEIYNFQELRRALSDRGFRFHTRTDTEVLLASYAAYGPACLEQIRGMFAFAIWDRLEGGLFAARDRIGKKPFYYYFAEDRFAFSSEIKSLLEIGVGREIDPTALIDYLKYLYVPHPKSIYRQIRKLEPGHYLTYRNGALKITEYWDVDFSRPVRADITELEEELLHKIEEAVRCRLISDVPLGAFLSGGVDSSGIVALMARTKDRTVKTCTIGFDDKKHDEAVYAKAFAARLGTDHHEYYIHDEPARIIKKLVWHCDEPFADSSMVPTYYVSEIARKNVTVALSGDGGDENFAGYDKYTVDRYENLARQWVPGSLLSGVMRFTQEAERGPLKRLHSLCRSSLLSPAEAFYVTNTFITDRQLRRVASDSFRKEVEAYDPSGHVKKFYDKANGPDHLSRILYTDLKLYLPGDILAKVDRMSMANSLEVRSPLLDHKIIEYAARIPSSLKLHGTTQKYLLKRAFGEIVGKDIIHREKHGFVVPLADWLRHELRPMAEDALFANEQMAPYFHLPEIRTLWDRHLSGKEDHGTVLWSLFIFSLWLECFKPQ